MNNYKTNQYELTIEQLYHTNDELVKTNEALHDEIERLNNELASSVMRNAHTFTYRGYNIHELFLLAEACKANGIHPEDIRKNAINMGIAYRAISQRLHKAIDTCIDEYEVVTRRIEEV